MTIEKTVFISYRRTNAFNALAIYQNLTQHGFEVFFDYESINSGDFGQIILNQIASRAHFIVLLTPSSLERCNEPNDWLRREIEFAIESKRNIVPLMFDGFTFSDFDKYMSGKLSMLRNYNSMSVPVEYFEAAMQKLRDKFLNISLKTVIHPTTVKEETRVKQVVLKISRRPIVTVDQLASELYFERAQKRKSVDIEEQIRDYNLAIKLNPSFGEAYNNRGLAFEKKEELDKAMADFKKAIKTKHSQVHLSYLNLGNIYLSKNEFNLAIEQYNKALKINPFYEDAINNRGIALRHKGQIEEAIDNFTYVLSINPVAGSALFNRAVAYAKKGDHHAAIADFDHAILLMPNDSGVFHMRGISKAEIGQYDEAIDNFSNAIKLSPSNYAGYYCRALVWKLKSNNTEAIKDYSEVIRLNPQNVDAWNNRGEARYQEGDIVGAIEDYDNAIKINPSYAIAYNNRASIYFDQNRFDLALADYETALKHFPSNNQIQDNLRLVREKMKI